jgi:hypothetical protein
MEEGPKGSSTFLCGGEGSEPMAGDGAVGVGVGVGARIQTVVRVTKQ